MKFNMKLKEERGVTLLALAITIIVLLILAGISLYSGKDTINKANLQSLRTNMLLIEAKTKEYVEQVNFKRGSTKDETKAQEARNAMYVENGLVKIEDGASIPNEVKNFNNYNGDTGTQKYYITSEALEKMGLKQIKMVEGEYYIVSFDEDNISVEVYNTIGNEGKYSLSSIEENQ